ncbi:MAG: peptidase M16 [Paraglaciecola sp.]|nr:peptidase M16 [Paraglaciecola sp.]
MINRSAILLCSLFAVALQSCHLNTQPAITSNQPATATSTVVKSPIDKREYRYVMLDNGLKVLLISDPQADKSAAAMDVSAGAFHAPRDRAGLLHFLEHMLFLGTEKYPDAGEYNEYLKKNGGGSNAYTAEEDTNYFFDVKNEAFDGALDRFAQFFIAPTLDPQFVEREKNAVDSEYSLKIKDENRRIREVNRQTINPAHPYSLFSVGNLATLADRENSKVYNELLKVYQQHYSANRMALVVLSNISLDELEKSVNNKFAAIKNNGAAKPQINVPFLSENELATQVNIVPLRDIRTVDLTFPITDTQQFIDKKPMQLISALLGSQAKHSLYAQLKEQGLIESLSTYTENTDAMDVFNISIELTENGLTQINSVIEEVFAYLDLIKQHGVTQSYYDELKKIADLDFTFQEASGPTTTVYTLAPVLQHTAPADLLNIDYQYRQFDPTLIKQYLAELNPNNMQMTIVAQGLYTDKTEPLYDVSYSVQKIAESQLQQWRQAKAQAGQTLPELNPFIAQDITLKPAVEQNTPSLIIDNVGLTVWHYQDTSFAQPKADVYVRIASPLAGDTAKHRAMLTLANRLIDDSLKSYGYNARRAGLDYRLSDSDRGLRFTVMGYNDKQPRLIDAISTTINGFDVSQAQFDQQKTSLLRDWQNAALARPISQVFAKRNRSFGSDPYSDKQKTDALQSVTLSELTNYLQTFLAKVNLQVLVHGNVTAAEAQGLSAKLHTAFLNYDNAIAAVKPVVRSLAKGETTVVEMDINNQDSAIVMTYPSEPSMLGLRDTRMLAQILSAAFFNDIRTTQQLGYVAAAFANEIRDVPTLNFYIQSSKVGPVELQRRVASFIDSQYQALQAMTAEEFAEHKAGLLSDINSKDKNLPERSARLWGELDDGLTEFDKREQLTLAINAMSKEQLQNAYSHLLIGPDSRRLISRNFGLAHRDSDYQQALQDQTVCRAEQCW